MVKPTGNKTEPAAKTALKSTPTREQFREMVKEKLAGAAGIGCLAESTAARDLRANAWKVEPRARFLSPDDFNRWDEIDLRARKTLFVDDFTFDVVLHISCTSSIPYGWAFYILDRIDARARGVSAYARKPFPAAKDALEGYLDLRLWEPFKNQVADGCAAWKLDSGAEARDRESFMWEKIEIAVRSTAAALWETEKKADTREVHLPVVLFDGHLVLAQLDAERSQPSPTVLTPDTIAYRCWYDIPRALRTSLEQELVRIGQGHHSESTIFPRVCEAGIDPLRLRSALTDRLTEVPKRYFVHVLHPGKLQNLLAFIEKTLGAD